MQHHFDTDLACKYGILEAILINHFEFWIEQNEKNERNFYNDKYWTYNSMRAFSEIFPYASQRKIRSALKHLEEEGIIVIGNYNKSTYDRTLWYAFSDFGKSILQKRKMDITKMSNGICENVEPIPNNNHIITSNNNPYINNSSEKILEGNYKNNNQKANQNKPKNGFVNFDQRKIDFAELAKRKQRALEKIREE